MKKLLLILFLIPTALWSIVGVPIVLAKPEFWTYRSAAVILSGIVTLFWMALAVLLATRSSWIEKKLGGLDKVYFLHKWIGIWVGVFSTIHWIAEQGIKKIGKWGIAELPPRIKAPKAPMSEFWHNMRDWAKDLGEWAFYIMLILILIALFKKLFSYKVFRLTHLAFPILFLMGAFHGLVLMPDAYWQSPVAWIVAFCCAFAIVASLWILAGLKGKKKQSQASIAQIAKEQDGTLLLTLNAPHWQGHQAGQFLFIHFGDKLEGAHPFTIASAWDFNNKSIRLGIKPLGDFTKQLAQHIKVGDSVRLEGPYGDFVFDNDNASTHQIWIAGGVGVTPFVARLNDLALKNQKMDVDFFCSQRNRHCAFLNEIQSLCQKTGVRLHLWLSDEKGVIPSDNISQVLKENSRVWFCGPFAWGENLLKQFQLKGFSAKNFLRERFEFR